VPDESVMPRRARGARSTHVGRRIAIVVAVVFGGLAAWLANQEPPRITHAEAMVMATAVEQATTLAQLQQLVRFTPPAQAQPLTALPSGGTMADPAEAILFRKSIDSYTFVGTRGEGTDDTRLLFRCEKDLILGDYQEVRLRRLEGQVRITDLWSMAWDGWMRDLLEERARLAPGDKEPHRAFDAAIADKAPANLVAAFRALPEAYRRARTVGAAMLWSLDSRDVVVFRDGISAHREMHKAGHAADLASLRAAQVQLKVTGRADSSLIEDALAALQRIWARVDDGDFLQPWRTELRR